MTSDRVRQGMPQMESRPARRENGAASGCTLSTLQLHENYRRLVLLCRMLANVDLDLLHVPQDNLASFRRTVTTASDNEAVISP